MSPPVAVNGAAKDFKKESTLARLLGSGSAGIAELAVFHPVDTIAKRLMSNHGRITSAAQLNQVIFKEKAAAPAGTKFFSLFPGLGYAAGYKVLQRVYKYGGQPFVRDYLAKHHGTEFDRAFGPKTGKAMMHSFAGSLIGIGEIVLLPLDVLKIKRQTNPEAFRGRGVLRIVRDEASDCTEAGVGLPPETRPVLSLYSVAPHLLKATCLASQTITRPLGPRTLLLPSLVLPHLSLSPHLWMLLRREFRTETLITRKVGSESLAA